MSRSTQPILIVEDSDEHFEAVCRAFKKAGVANPIQRCHDGDEALDYLHGQGAYGDGACRPRPAVVLLDLNLPGTDGREVLEHIKASEQLKALPVVVLSTSSSPGDIELCYQAGASGYIVKPLEFARLLQTIEHLKLYWFDTVALPAS